MLSSISTQDLKEELKRRRTCLVPMKDIADLPEVQGAFRVARDGTVYRKTRCGWTEVTPTTDPNGRPCVSVYTGGKQKRFYVRRLVAEAHVPNPENHPYVVNLDDDYGNVHADNLAWAGNEERVKRAIQSLKALSAPCKSCGKPTRTRDGICPACHKSANAAEEARAQWLERHITPLQGISLDALSQRDRQIVMMRQEGKGLRQIGVSFGLTHERVRQIIKKALARDKLRG